jgi:hypothetical protein
MPAISIEQPARRQSLLIAELAVVPAGDLLRGYLQHHPLRRPVARSARCWGRSGSNRAESEHPAAARAVGVTRSDRLSGPSTLYTSRPTSIGRGNHAKQNAGLRVGPSPPKAGKAKVVSTSSPGSSRTADLRSAIAHGCRRRRSADRKSRARPCSCQTTSGIDPLAPGRIDPRCWSVDLCGGAAPAERVVPGVRRGLPAGCHGRGDGSYARFLKRQLSIRVSTISRS